MSVWMQVVLFLLGTVIAATSTISTFKSSLDGQVFKYRSWFPTHDATPVRGSMYVIHGMAEHSGRYAEFAQEMADTLNIRVLALDQRAHGLTACPHFPASKEGLGILRRGPATEQSDAISLMGEDICDFIRSTNTGEPFVIFGHSMGSVTSRAALAAMDASLLAKLRGVVLSGVPAGPMLPEVPLVKAAGVFVKKTGYGLHLVQPNFIWMKFHVPLMLKLLNPALADNAFVSSDPSEIEKFNRDPLTGHLVDADILVAVASHLRQLLDPKHYFKNLSSVKIPFLFVSGRDDPVGGFGATPAADAAGMAGIGQPVAEIFLHGARHEFINEAAPIRKLGVQQVMAWVNSVFLEK